MGSTAATSTGMGGSYTSSDPSPNVSADVPGIKYNVERTRTDGHTADHYQHNLREDAHPQQLQGG